MQVFEFHFNPKVKEGLIFDSFCYEPENIYEKEVGSLYMVGLLKNVLPPNLRFLGNLSRVIEESYYRITFHSPEKQLKESLRTANEFLERSAKSGSVGWLGNLSFAVLSLKNFELNFTKVGDSKVFLLRGGQVTDIDRKVRFQEIEPYPLKIFGNIVTGKLAEDDIVLVLTKEVSEFFQSQDFLTKIAGLAPGEQNFGAGLKQIFDSKKDELSKISGVCLLIFLSKEALVRKKEAILPQPEKFSLKKVFSPIVITIKGLIERIKPPKVKLPKARLPKVKLPKIAIPKVTTPKPNRNLIVILVLILFLALGFFVFQKEKEQQLKEYQTTLNQIQEKVNQAESFLILAETKPEAQQEANSLLKETWEEILPLTKIVSTLPQNLSSQVFSLKDEISGYLYELNELIEIPEPELLFEFNAGEFVPQKMIFNNASLYFFSPYAKNLFKVNKNGEGEIIQIDKKFNLAVSFNDSILFFSKPDQLVNFKAGHFGETFSLEEPYPNFNFDNFSSYKSGLYFLDKKSGEIIKYPYLKNFEWDSPQLWLNPQTKKATEAKSMAIDGSVWILNQDNSINRYYTGTLQETLSFDIFPEPKNFSKIFASPTLTYLYILEPVQKRIIILNKSGQVVKQFQSEKFDNLLDFAISDDAKTIYLLNGLKVYQINL